MGYQTYFVRCVGDDDWVPIEILSNGHGHEDAVERYLGIAYSHNDGWEWMPNDNGRTKIEAKLSE